MVSFGPKLEHYCSRYQRKLVVSCYNRVQFRTVNKKTVMTPIIRVERTKKSLEISRVELGIAQ